jgi:hypothetical protein
MRFPRETMTKVEEEGGLGVFWSRKMKMGQSKLHILALYMLGDGERRYLYEVTPRQTGQTTAH